MPRILIGGDSEAMLHVHDRMREELGSSGCSIVYCATPGEIVSRLREGPAQLILLFFESAPISTADTCHLIRKVPGVGTPPIMVWDEDADSWGMQGIHPLPPSASPQYAVRESATLLGLHTIVQQVDAAVWKQQQEEEQQAIEQETPETKHETRLRSLNIRTRTGMASTQSSHMISDSFRRRWFYESNSIQEFFDSVEDSLLFQRICDWRYGKLSGDVPEDEESTSGSAALDSVGGVTITSISGEAVVNPRDQGTSGVIRGIVILGVVLALCILGMYGTQYKEGKNAQTEDVRQGKLTHIVCLSCGLEKTQQVQNINRECCQKCRGRMGFSYKCEKCGKTFVHEVDDRKIKTVDDIVPPPKCPECGHKKTHPYLPPPESYGK